MLHPRSVPGVSEGWPRRTVADPDGREVVFDAGSHLHLVRRMRSELLNQVDEILAAVAAPVVASLA